MIDGAGTELPVKFLGAHGPKLVDVAGPEVEDVVPGEGGSLLDDGDPGAEQLGLDGGAEADRTRAHHDQPRVGGQHVVPEHAEPRPVLQQLEQRRALD